ncbi:tetratricopeptide repeat protein [Aromatoleum anaerobium]|uniref:Tetratricopeptide repeat protein n=1 Tax=Aromatoleum anaerobium TaxID=182180 RepID=A0ABX1PFG4_9RHOO|nr:hypothetical protein [Aromatoleum anaerobium]MCK0509214.1 hypothetical protein [Aromatoleum anaerobium]
MKRLLIAGLLACPLCATAVEQFSPSAAELRMLPPFCTDRLEKGSGGKNVASAARLGKANYLHIHHYCFAVNFVNRATRAHEKKNRLYNLGLAKNNYLYVINATEPRFWMRPQIYVELGKVLLQLKEAGDAVRLFNEAITFNPAYEPAYHALIDLQRQSGRAKDGLEVATAGLQRIPDSRSLKKAYLELGGKEPFPEPVVKAAPVPPETSSTPEPDPAGTPAGAAVTTAEGAAVTSGLEAPGGSAPAPTSGCRFCPPEEIQRKWEKSFKGGQE